MSSDGRQGLGDPKRRKRIITNARKEQNRIAQQLYRQRQRESAQNPESHRHDFAGKHHLLQPRPHQVEDTLPEATERITTHAGGAAKTQTPLTESNYDNCDALFSESALQPDSSRSLDPGYMMHGFAPGGEINADERLTLSMSSTVFFPGVDSSMLINAPSYAGTLFQDPSMGGEADELGPMIGPSPSNLLDVPVTNQVPLTMVDFSNWPASMDSTQRSYCASEIPGEKPANIPLWLSSTIQDSDCYTINLSSQVLDNPRNLQNNLMDATSTQTRAVQRIISTISRFLYGFPVPTNSSSSSTPSLPDPHINSLQCCRTATVLAYFRTAHCLGLEIENLFCCKSPFYHPNVTMADDPQALLAAARRPWTPANLQPTLPQILIPHYQYLDLIPFPEFRARAIMFAASSPQLFNAMELKKDILRDGIYWDIRKWVAAPWFLRKWRLLLS